MAMKDLDKEVRPEQIIDFDDGTESGITDLFALLEGPQRPDGILANGDLAALVAIKCLRQMKLRMPEDVAIVGFGDSTFCPYLDPALSSVSQRNEDVGRLSAETILKELQIKDKGEIVYIRQMLPPKLVIRASSSRTAKHWVDNLIKPVLIMMIFFRAEREADWSIHLWAVAAMQPYFFVTAHFNYARQISVTGVKI